MAQPGVIALRPWKLSDSSLARVYSEMLRHADSSAWVPVRVAPGQALSAILYERFGVGDTYRGAAGRTLQQAVIDYNNLKATANLRAGQTIYLPPLPSYVERPGAQSAATAAQAWSMGGTSIKGRASRQVPTAAWLIELPHTPGTAAYQDALREMFGAPFAEWLAAFTPFDQALEARIDAPELRIAVDTLDPVPADLAAAPAVTAGATLFVLDFFADACGHGQQVLDVVRAVLTQLGLGALNTPTNVIAIDMDLRRGLNGKRQTVQRWIKERGYDAETAALLLKSFDAEAANASGASGPMVSMFHQIAVVDSVLRTKGARVMTSSFRVDSPMLYAMESSVKVGSQEMFFRFSSSGNDGKAVEDLADWSRREPHKTLYDMRRNYPFYLVGGELRRGVAYGNWSNEEFAVPFVARASGWTGQCIHDNEKGTSFASPALAASLFGALSAWNARSYRPPTWASAERRLIASVSPGASLIGRYAAPGSVVPEKLLLPVGTFATSRTGRVLTSPTVATGSVTIVVDGDARKLGVGRQAADELWALAFDGADVLFASSRSRNWQRGKLIDLRLMVPAAIGLCQPQEAQCEVTSIAVLQAALSDIGVHR